MECAVGCPDDTGVAHHFLLANLRFQPGAGNGLPMPSVVAVDEPQTLCSGFVERGGYIDFTLGESRYRNCHE